MTGNIGFTAILSGLAVAISAATYIANKRRAMDANTSPPFSSRPLLDKRKYLTASHAASGGVGQADGVHSTASSSVSPLHSYYALCAEQHVSRHSANVLEWRDDVLGVRMRFSPILFAVEREERQAPLVLVALRYLRQPEHSVAVTLEACAAPTGAEEYRDSSLERIRDCAKLLAGGTTRIGSVPCPVAEYCYVDESHRLRYALSVFLTHQRLAVTAQYVADTRVKGVLPTAFNELVRSITFSPPRPTPSYVLCSEPRLGLGLRLPLDFAMDDALREALTDEDAARCGDDGADGAERGALFAVLVAKRPREMVVFAAHEPPGRALHGAVARQLRASLERGGVRLGSAPDVVWDSGRPGGGADGELFAMRPYELRLSAVGDAGVEDGDAQRTVVADGALCVRAVELAAGGACAARLQSAPSESAGGVCAFWGFVSLRIGGAHVSVTFLAPAAQHTLESFVPLCRRAVDTLSVGNHLGQGTALTYCNARHAARPFRLHLSVPGAAVEEPWVGDPLAVLRVGAGAARVAVVLRAFPCAGAGLGALERAVRRHLAQLPEVAAVRVREVFAPGGRPALEVQYDTNEAEAEMEDAIGHRNPFARCAPDADGDGAGGGRDAASAPASSGGSAGEEAARCVAVAVGAEGCAFLFLAAPTEGAQLGAARVAVRQLAAGLAVANS